MNGREVLNPKRTKSTDILEEKIAAAKLYQEMNRTTPIIKLAKVAETSRSVAKNLVSDREEEFHSKRQKSNDFFEEKIAAAKLYLERLRHWPTSQE